jgi:hypothetical protein
MFHKIIPVTHLFFAIFMSFYAFIIPKNLGYDYFYVTVLILTQLSWLAFNHECPLSYLYKSMHYPNYTCGDTNTLDDFKELNVFSSEIDKKSDEIGIIHIVNLLFCIALIISVIVVAYRSRISNPILLIFVCVVLRFFYLLFNDATGYDTNYTGNYLLGKHYLPIQEFYFDYGFKNLHTGINTAIGIILVGFWSYITFKNRKNIL